MHFKTFLFSGYMSFLRTSLLPLSGGINAMILLPQIFDVIANECTVPNVTPDLPKYVRTLCIKYPGTFMVFTSQKIVLCNDLFHIFKVM